jgi:hypothetical protein
MQHCPPARHKDVLPQEHPETNSSCCQVPSWEFMPQGMNYIKPRHLFPFSSPPSPSSSLILHSSCGVYLSAPAFQPASQCQWQEAYRLTLSKNVLCAKCTPGSLTMQAAIWPGQDNQDCLSLQALRLDSC